MPNTYRLMMSDRTRTEAFEKAINEIINKGDTVLDLGCGPGLLSLFACKAGAAKVYAIDQNTKIIDYGRKLAHDNGYKDKIEFISGLSYDIELPEKVDVIISETLGTYAVDEHIIECIYDARTRFLKKGGTIIPSEISIYIAPVECPQGHNCFISGWEKDYFGFDFTSLNNSPVIAPFSCAIEKTDLLSNAALVKKFTLKDKLSSYRKNINFCAQRKGVIHGIGLWFEAVLSPLTTLSTAPGKPPTHWQQGLLLIQHPIEVRQNDQISVSISYSCPQGKMIMDWAVECNDRKFEFSARQQKEQHRKLTDLNYYFHQPRLSAMCRINKEILNMCDGNRTIEEIGVHLTAEFPENFKYLDQAIEKIAGVLESRT